MCKKLSTEEFIEKSNKFHNFKYIYDKVDYKNSYTKVCITCSDHGDFWQTPANHLKYGCKECGKAKHKKELKRIHNLNLEMSKHKKRLCKICGKSEIPGKFCKGLCHLHYEQVRMCLIDESGSVINRNYYIDDKGYIQKIKSNLQLTVRECDWYREWTRNVLKLHNKKCTDCGISGIRLFIHHEKISFSEIINEAKIFSDKLEEQILYCKEKHTLDIALCLCGRCHANHHKGDKIYNLMLNKLQDDKCKICDLPTYCKNFCKLHYGRYRSGIYDLNGNKLRLMKKEVDGINRKNNPCKLCKRSHYSIGFCSMHYGRYRSGQIDINGNELRKIHNWNKKGNKYPRVFLTFDKDTLSIDRWAEKLNISKSALEKRLQKWSLERALGTPNMGCNTTKNKSKY